MPDIEVDFVPADTECDSTDCAVLDFASELRSLANFIERLDAAVMDALETLTT